MIRLLALLLCAATLAGAETVQLRSGEHAGFSRLVLELAQPSGWAFGRVGDEYELRLARDDITLDPSQVFRFIPQVRLQSLQVQPGAATLRLRTAPDTHAKAFDLRAGVIVIDIASGAADASSPFEAQLAPPQGPATPPAPADPARGTALFAPAPLQLSPYWRNFSNADAAAPVPAPRAGPAAANLRLREAESELLMQLGRAASQGLVTFDLPQAPADAPAGSPPAAAYPGASDHLALRSETAFDRAAQDLLGQTAPAPENVACIADSALDLAGWAGELPAFIAIGNLRPHLLGEFDRPDAEVVLALTRLYLALGFGAEARVLLATFGADAPDRDVLADIGAIVDAMPVAAASRLRGMAHCDGGAALWAVLANPDLQPGDAINHDAVSAAFSALPAGLRQLLGPRLTARMLALGASEDAFRLRDAVTRAPGADGDTVAMIAAQLATAAGAPQRAAASLALVIAQNGPHAPAALVQYVDAVMAQGLPADPGLIETAAALAFEHRLAPDGAVLARAHALAAASAGQFTRAFAAAAAMPDPQLAAAATAEIFAPLTASATDAVFVEQVFAQAAALARISDWPLQLRLAARLLDLGFTSEARRLLGPGANRFAEGRVLLARAALRERDGTAALAQLAGLADDEANRLRGAALALLGEHDAARRAYALAATAKIGDETSHEATGTAAAATLAAEAWRAGDWPLVAEIGTAAQRGAVIGLGVAATPSEAATDTPEGTPPPGPLTQAKALLNQSRGAREAVAELLRETDVARATAADAQSGN